MPPPVLQLPPQPGDVLVGAFVDGRWEYGTLESRTTVRLMYTDPPRTCTVQHESDLRLVQTSLTVTDGGIVRLLDAPDVCRPSKDSDPPMRLCVRVALYASDMQTDPFFVVESALREVGYHNDGDGDGVSLSSGRWFADIFFSDNVWYLWLDREIALAICGRGVRVGRKVVVCGMMLTDEEDVFPTTPLWYDDEDSNPDDFTNEQEQE